MEASNGECSHFFDRVFVEKSSVNVCSVVLIDELVLNRAMFSSFASQLTDALELF